MAGYNPAGPYRHEALDTVVSTNSEAMQRARDGDPGRLWLTAERQMGGRGRRGRNWVSERGNLYASLLLVDPAPQSATGSLPLVAAVAVERAISQMLAGHAGAVAIMPLGAPIGSGLGIQNRVTIRLIVEGASVPVLVDAGVGTASDAAVGMELGCDGILMNTAIAEAKDPIRMARAMKLAVRAGRDAYLSGRMATRKYADPSSPLAGLI